MAAKKCSDEDILNFIRAYADRKGYAPTKREIGDGCGLVVSASHSEGIASTHSYHNFSHLTFTYL